MNELEKEGLRKIFDSFETVALIANDNRSIFKTLRNGKTDEWLKEKEWMINDVLNKMQQIENTAVAIMKTVKQEVDNVKP